ncbi:hypothetical protein ACIU1J_27870 [Azospirillum doebereinerae]|uniref:hypothetical protein n=1 Tax=Azospirillum doebereinerae TaxID=92933 RepID=UPI001EE5FD2C|nr:hypothetical protein [Azospirillum doebereinerae]MCG5238180.1 hypothetical protein [Azospirillum doebereinerae]
MVDLHDSARAVGAEQTGGQNEFRPGTSSGVYPAIAWDILEELRDVELTGTVDFVDLAPISSRLTDRYSVAPGDVQYVALTLATPTRIDFARHGEAGERISAGTTTETALLRKQRRGHAYMLAPAGREALALASGYFKFVHAGAEAQKLIDDIQFADFDGAQQIAVRLISKVRTESYDVRRHIETPEIEGLRAAFVANADRYQKSIKEIAQAVPSAQSLLRSEALLAQVDLWAKSQGQEDGYLLASTLNGLLSTLADAVAALQRNFSDLISAVGRRERSFVGVPRFDDAARNLLRRPAIPAIETLERIACQSGLLLPVSRAFDPLVLNGSVAMRVPRAATAPSRRRIVDDTPSIDRVDAFVAKNRDAILARLENGPVSLSDMLANDEDWLDTFDLDNLAEIATLALAPYIIGIDEDRLLRLSLEAPAGWNLSDNWQMAGPEIMMSLVAREDAP